MSKKTSVHKVDDCGSLTGQVKDRFDTAIQPFRYITMGT